MGARHVPPPFNTSSGSHTRDFPVDILLRGRSFTAALSLLCLPSAVPSPLPHSFITFLAVAVIVLTAGGFISLAFFVRAKIRRLEAVNAFVFVHNDVLSHARRVGMLHTTIALQLRHVLVVRERTTRARERVL